MPPVGFEPKISAGEWPQAAPLLRCCIPRRGDLYLTTHNTQYRQTSVPPVGFEPTIAAGERPQTYVLDSAATGICCYYYYYYY